MLPDLWVLGECMIWVLLPIEFNKNNKRKDNNFFSAPKINAYIVAKFTLRKEEPLKA